MPLRVIERILNHLARKDRVRPVARQSRASGQANRLAFLNYSELDSDRA
jgi:hypothetical protein